ncbi:MAG: 6-carboxytetrahydropterin synthase [Proteobacteria bacterium]|nr:6-carboxytetrahydropterin synthase [Pseudomonadota bacterium]
MERLTTLHIDKESHKFSAAHYTIFSADSRERLHGHNYSVSVRIVAPVGDNGLSADYNVYKSHLKILCDSLDEYVLLAGNSPFQEIEKDGPYYRVKFDRDEMLFLQSDTQVLPILNATIEEFSHLLLRRLLERCVEEDLREIELCVASGAGQRASSIWKC